MNISNSSFYTDKFKFDTPEPWGLFFQDNATPQMEGLEELHNNIMYYLAIILFAVSWIMVSIIINYKNAKISNKYSNRGTLVESIRTITPALILILIAFPSFKLLYLMDEVVDPSSVIYGEGHQWYFSEDMSANTLKNLDDGAPSSSRPPYSGEGSGGNSGRNTGGNTGGIRRENDCMVRHKIYDKDLSSIDIRISSYPWAEVFNNPIKQFFPHLSSETVPPREFDFSVSSDMHNPVKEIHFQGRSGDGIHQNDALWKAVEDKSKTVSDLRELYDPEYTSNKWTDVRAIRNTLVSGRVTSTNAAWLADDPYGYNFIKELRILRALESGLKVTDPTYISRISPLPFETSEVLKQQQLYRYR